MQSVRLHLLFTILYFSAGQALKTIYYFLMQNQIRIQPKTVSENPSHSTTTAMDVNLHLYGHNHM